MTVCPQPLFDERILWVEDGQLRLASLRQDQHHLETMIKRWREREAKRYLTQRVRELSERTGWHVRRISFRYQTTMWASCSSEKNLSLNVQLIQIEPDLIDYVLIHELAHTVEMNHSRAFWRLVALHCPDYPEKKRRLVGWQRVLAS